MVTSPPVTRSPSPLNAISSSSTTKANAQSSSASSNPCTAVNSSSGSSLLFASNQLQSKSSSSFSCKNDNNSKNLSSLDSQITRNKGTVKIGSDSTHMKESLVTSNQVIPKLTIDVTLGSTRSKQKQQPPTTLSNETYQILQPNLIILNTPPSPATTPISGDNQANICGQRNLSPQTQHDSAISNGQGNTLTPTYLSSTTSSSLKPSPATSPLAALKRHPGTKTPTSDPVSPNIPTHHELDRRHSDSTNWPNLSVSTKVFTSASTSSAASSMNSTSTAEASDSQDSPLLHRSKLSQNGRELTVGKNNHTYQNTNLVGTGNKLLNFIENNM